MYLIFNPEDKVPGDDIKKELPNIKNKCLNQSADQIKQKMIGRLDNVSLITPEFFEKVNKRGGFDDIERDNRIANTQIATRFENILNNQLIDEDEATTIRSLMTKGKKNRKYGAGASKAASIMTSSTSTSRTTISPVR